MSYFDFNYVTDPPLDELVNIETEINANWEEVELKTAPFNQRPSNFGAITPTKGTEAYSTVIGSENRIAVWNGSAWNNTLSTASGWTAWQTLNIRAPTVLRPGFTPQARVHSFLRKVEICGGVLADGAASAWSTATTVEITTDTAIQASFAPANTSQQTFRQGAVGAITAASGFASAVIIIEKKTGPDRTAISVRYQGDAGGGNFIMFDNISWWY